MNSAIERLISLRVDDVMTRDVVTVSANNTMAEAADILNENNVTGAPVLDETGRCIGVLSGSDYISCKAAAPKEGEDSSHVLTSSSTGVYYVDEVLHDLVRSHMSSAVQTVELSCSMLQAARCLCDEHVHRLIVIDEHGAPVGIFTSLDIVAAMIAAVEE